MGQPETLNAVIALCKRYGRPVTKHEIVEETGTSVASVTYSLLRLKRWGEVTMVELKPATRGCPNGYKVGDI